MESPNRMANMNRVEVAMGRRDITRAASGM
jgi:hypothetical protein